MRHKPNFLEYSLVISGLMFVGAGFISACGSAKNSKTVPKQDYYATTTTESTEPSSYNQVSVPPGQDPWQKVDDQTYIKGVTVNGHLCIITKTYNLAQMNTWCF